MQSTVQSLLLIILPLLGLILPGILKQDKFSPLANSVISGIVVVLFSGATAYTKDQFGPNFFLDAGIVLAGISALLSGPLKGLDAFLQSNVFALISQQLPMIEHAVASLNTSSAQVSPLSNALIHITANTVHIPATAPTLSPVVTDSQITSANIQQIATQAIQDVTPVPDPVEVVQERSGAGAIVPDVTPVMTGITTPDEAGQKTQKIAVVKPTTALAN
jgi:hypothetical protein